jgi:hypothetical protein
MRVMIMLKLLLIVMLVSGHTEAKLSRYVAFDQKIYLAALPFPIRDGRIQVGLSKDNNVSNFALWNTSLLDFQNVEYSQCLDAVTEGFVHLSPCNFVPEQIWQYDPKFQTIGNGNINGVSPTVVNRICRNEKGELGCVGLDLGSLGIDAPVNCKWIEDPIYW